MVFDARAQRRARALQRGLDAVLGHAELSGELPAANPIAVEAKDEVAGSRRQSPHALARSIHPRVTALALPGFKKPGFHLLRPELGVAATAVKAVDEQATRHREGPPLRGGILARRIGGPEPAHQRVLGQVLGILWLASQDLEKADEMAPMAADHLGGRPEPRLHGAASRGGRIR